MKLKHFTIDGDVLRKCTCGEKHTQWALTKEAHSDWCDMVRYIDNNAPSFRLGGIRGFWTTRLEKVSNGEKYLFQMQEENRNSLYVFELDAIILIKDWFYSLNEKEQQKALESLMNRREECLRYYGGAIP